MISDETRRKIDAEITLYPKPRGALLPALHLVHAEHGFVSKQVAIELAGIFGRGVDLVQEDCLKNPFRRRSILRAKETIYAA